MWVGDVYGQHLARYWKNNKQIFQDNKKEYRKYRNLESQEVGNTDCSILQRIGNKIEKAFEQQGPIKTQPCSTDQIQGVAFTFKSDGPLSCEEEKHRDEKAKK